MKANKINIILITATIVILGGYFFASTFYIEKGMTENLKLLEKHTKNEHWDKALKLSKDIEKDWDKKKFLVMCNYGESEFDGFEGYINDISGSVRSKDSQTILTTILSAKDEWKNLNKLVPLP